MESLFDALLNSSSVKGAINYLFLLPIDNNKFSKRCFCTTLSTIKVCNNFLLRFLLKLSLQEQINIILVLCLVIIFK